MSRSRPITLARLVAQRIAAARRARGWTQDQLAERLGLATRNLQRLESGAQNLTLETIERIAKALAVVPESLLPPAPAGPLPATEDGRPPRLVPVVELRAAAGLLADPRSARAEGWWPLEAPESEELFVARVHGDSMASVIPAGSFALFRAPVSSLAKGAVALFVVRTAESPDDGGSYLVKRFTGEEALPSGKRRVTLSSENPAYPPLVVEITAHDDVRAIATFVRVLP